MRTPSILSRRKLLGFLASTSPALCAQAQAPIANVTVAAASDLKFALEELAASFTQASGWHVRLIFGSTGNFYSQLLQGAPFHLFLSADEDFVFKLAEAGKTLDRGHLYAVGRLAIIVPKNSPVKADSELKDLAAALQDGRLKRFVIANPEHAPYGMRAVEALRHRGLYEHIAARLVYGENVSQAAQFALSGSTQGGIVAQSLAIAPVLQMRSEFALLPASWHQALNQRMVLLKNPSTAAKAFYDFLASPAAQSIFSRYGFARPIR